MPECIAIAEIPHNERTEDLLKQATDLLFVEIGVGEMGVASTDLVEYKNYMYLVDRDRLFVGVNKLGIVIGAATLYRSGYSESEVSNIAVAHDYRRNHIGARLLSAVESVAREEGTDTMIVFPLKESRPFYMAQGFKIAFDNDGSYMTKTLK